MNNTNAMQSIILLCKRLFNLFSTLLYLTQICLATVVSGRNVLLNDNNYHFPNHLLTLFHLTDMAIVASSLIDFLIPLIVQNIGVFDARVFRVLRVFRAIRALRVLRTIRSVIAKLRSS